MSTKTAVMLGTLIGSVIGGYIPSLWGASLFSYSSLLGNAIGGIAGIIIAYKMTS